MSLCPCCSGIGSVVLRHRHLLKNARVLAEIPAGCRGAIEKKTVLENLDLALLAIDEIIDRG